MKIKQLKVFEDFQKKKDKVFGNIDMKKHELALEKQKLFSKKV